MSSSRDSKKIRNIVGPQIRKARNEKGWSQSQFAAKCNLAGWDVSRDVIARIEAQLRWVADFELLFLAGVLKTDIKDLLPKTKPKQAVMHIDFS